MASPTDGSHIDGPPQVDLDPSVFDMVARNPLPCFVIEVPSELIVAASVGAAKLLAPAGGGVVGQHLQDFLSDDRAGALELLQSGRLQGYEAVRHFERGDREVPF